MDLVIGDLHAQPNNIEETERLLAFIKATFIEKKCDKLIFLGDLTHTHAVMRQEVGHLLVRFFEDMYYNVVNENQNRLILLVGNHDGISPSITSENALDLTLSHVCNIVGNGPYIDFINNYAYMPFMYDNDKFKEAANNAYTDLIEMGAKDKKPVLFCHQTFDGAAYESGRLCPHGVKSEEIFFTVVISGHIHKFQIVKGKVIYLGTPRPVTAGEANESKHIHTIYRDDSGAINFQSICTDHIVKRYITVELKENSETLENTLQLLEQNDFIKDEVRVRIIGSQAFYDEYSLKCKHINKNIKTIPNVKRDLSKKVNLEATNDSIEVALEKYVKTVADMDIHLKEEVWKVIQAMVS
jgi:DNA repair exonuclease SbcCD nuclease subunit